MSRIVVGLSGGVDSSVAAYLLKKEGHEVIGLFMRNWREKDNTGHCTAEEDFGDVKRVSELLDIPYYSVDFSTEYWDRVFVKFVEEYKKGRTPNPDVLCNKEIKFKSFADYALKLGADYIATGHYAGVRHTENGNYLLRSKDENKDQTYFLNQLSSMQLDRVKFPLSNIEKSEVRYIAKEIGLVTADKKDSTGICFIGERNFREFLSGFIPMKEGNILDNGKVVGRHNGVYYYTLGQRKGLGIGGEGDRWFVVGKSVEKNELYVSHGDESGLLRSELTTESFNWINGEPQTRVVKARIRHRQPLQDAEYEIVGDGIVKVNFAEPQRAIASGQYVVLYSEEICLGGGVISNYEEKVRNDNN